MSYWFLTVVQVSCPPHKCSLQQGGPEEAVHEPDQQASHLHLSPGLSKIVKNIFSIYARHNFAGGALVCPEMPFFLLEIWLICSEILFYEEVYCSRAHLNTSYTQTWIFLKIFRHVIIVVKNSHMSQLFVKEVFFKQVVII